MQHSLFMAVACLGLLVSVGHAANQRRFLQDDRDQHKSASIVQFAATRAGFAEQVGGARFRTPRNKDGPVKDIHPLPSTMNGEHVSVLAAQAAEVTTAKPVAGAASTS